MERDGLMTVEDFPDKDFIDSCLERSRRVMSLSADDALPEISLLGSQKTMIFDGTESPVPPPVLVEPFSKTDHGRPRPQNTRAVPIHDEEEESNRPYPSRNMAVVSKLNLEEIIQKLEAMPSLSSPVPYDLMTDPTKKKQPCHKIRNEEAKKPLRMDSLEVLDSILVDLEAFNQGQPRSHKSEGVIARHNVATRESKNLGLRVHETWSMGDSHPENEGDLRRGHRDGTHGASQRGPLFDVSNPRSSIIHGKFSNSSTMSCTSSKFYEETMACVHSSMGSAASQEKQRRGEPAALLKEGVAALPRMRAPPRLYHSPVNVKR